MINLTQAEIFQIVFTVVGSLISLLLFGNLFFLKKLIHKVDLIDNLAASIGVLAKRVDELCTRIEIVNDLRIEVATVKAKLSSFFRHHKYDSADDEVSS